jgi:hypothetical protein
VDGPVSRVFLPSTFEQFIVADRRPRPARVIALDITRCR